MTDIRLETPADHLGIAAVNDAAFGGTDESHLIERLRADGLVTASLVADEYGEIVGHILFSDLEVVDSDHNRTIRACALAPMAVAPTHQKMGIGSELIRQGIDICKQLGIELIVVLGHENYYPRFGFGPEKAECLESPFSGPFFMVLELKSGILDDFTGKVIYPPAFGIDGQK